MCLSAGKTTTSCSDAVVTAKTTTERKIGIKEVEEHYTADDFWCVIDNVVYDLSKYEHPGGRIIMMCPGTDCTVLFHQHHYDKNGAPHKVLRKFKIGVLDLSTSPKSPVMGEFYERLSAGVVEELKDRPTRPWKCVFIMVFDYVVNIYLHYLSCCWLTPQSPIALIVLIPWLCECWSHRCTNHCHAHGHTQIFKSERVSIWVEYIMLMFGVGTMQIFAYPSEKGNIRHKMNEPRSTSRHEFSSGRGPYEHQGLHHPKATSFEEDGCFDYASASGWYRFASHQEPHWVHQFQKYEWYPFIIESGSIFPPYVYTMPMVAEAIWINFRNGMPVKGLCSIVCQAWLFVALYAIVITPLRCNLWATAFLFLPLRFLMLSVCKTFFMQHRFDALEDPSLPWGEAQLKACYQCNMEGLFLWISPIFWFCEGCKPSTSAFHLEHTLFPGINYLNLPKVAKVVDRTCEEMGIPIDYKLEGWWEVMKAHRALRLKYCPEFEGLKCVSRGPYEDKKNR